MNDLVAFKLSKQLFMEIPADTIQKWKQQINSNEPYDRYKAIIDIYQKGFVDCANYMKGDDICQKKLKTQQKQKN